MVLEVKKYRFTKLADRRYPSGYVEGEVVELPVLSAVGCPWWIPVEDTKLVEVTDEVKTSEMAEVANEAVPTTTELANESDSDVPQAVELMFPQRTVKKKKAG